jgi:putative ABC transport system permease protein
MDDASPAPDRSPAAESGGGPLAARTEPGRSSPRGGPARGIVRSLRGLSVRLAAAWWRSLLPLAASTAVLATVIGGAMGVGDAVGRGLLTRATGRLGRVGAAVVSQRLFRVELADELAACGPPRVIDRLEPVVILDLSAESSGRGAGGGAGGQRRTRTGLLACRDPSGLGWAWTAGPLAADTVAVNEPLAARLGIAVGDPIVLRTVARSEVASDSPLGRRDADPLSRRVTVAAVLPATGIGGFGLSPSQVDRPLVIASLETIGRLLREPGSANGILAVLRPDAATAEGSREAAAWIGESLRPTAADLGIEVRRDAGGVVRVSSTSLVLPPEVDRAAAAVLEPLGGSPTLVFLANAIRAEGGESVPYSTIAGIASPALPFGSLETRDGTAIAPIAPGQIVIDRWLADDLDRQGSPVGVGSTLAVEWFAPETLHGRVEERARAFTIAGVAEMRGAAVERSLVPDVKGVTDEASIADWDPPFPFDASRVRSTPPDDADDRYWKEFGATPKAFVSLADARQMAAGRFGRTTTWHCRVPEGCSAEAIARAIAERVHPARVGFAARPLLAEAIAASRGATPFGSLFAALSAYLVAAGLVLVWLLAALLVTARRPEIGVLAAVGWPRSRVAWLVWAVLGVAALAGAAAGAFAGPVWAGVLVAWLSRNWTGLAGGPSADAVADPVTRPLGVLAVALTGFTMAMAAAGTSAYRAAGEGVRGLLGGGLEPRPWSSGGRRGGRGKIIRWAGLACLLAAGGVMSGVGPGGDEVMLFFLGATLALVGLLAIARSWILPLPTRSLAGLAWCGVAESPGRSFAVVAIVAVAEFLIVAVSAFAVRDPVDPRERSGPTGGYDLVVSLATPAALDLSDPATLASAGLDPGAAAALAEATLLPLRATAGDDASCLNLYRAQSPLVVGVDAAFRSRGGFRFTARAGGKDGSAWRLLGAAEGGTTDVPPAASDSGSRRVPVILDDSTARYALGLSGIGATIDIVDGGGSTRTLEVVGLLAPGILQGMLIVAEEHFRELYPLDSGYRMLLADCGRKPGDSGRAAASGRVADAIGTLLGDFGAETVTTLERLRVLGAVQNIYLAGFQSLGVLGLLLGTAGVAATRLRSVLERQGAFALLLAIGFTPARLRLAVLTETLLLVLPGLAIGAVAGLLAVWPQFLDGRATLPVGWLAVSICLTSAAAAAAGAVVAGRAVVQSPVSFLRAI